MRKFLVASMLVVGLVACKSTPTTDPDNGVSNASYRLAITKGQSNVAAIVTRMLVAKDQDLKATTPAHQAAWWDAQIGELQATRNLLSDALLGATK